MLLIAFSFSLKAMNLQHPTKDKKGQTILFQKVLQRQNLFLPTLNGMECAKHFRTKNLLMLMKLTTCILNFNT